MEQLKRVVNAGNLLLGFSLYFLVQLLNYFFTGAGGPQRLATRLVPVALILYVLKAYRENALYPRLGPAWNRFIAAVYVAAAMIPLLYLEVEYEQLFIYRSGAYNTTDLLVGAVLLLLVMEISRKAHPVLFGVNIVMMLYTLYGNYSPIDFFWHPGASLTRVVTAATVELSTGIYGKYAQLGLTLVAAFLLMAAIAGGFDAQGSLLRVVRALAGRRTHQVPQTAVISSMAVGMVSGSGAANTAVTGSVTIPLMKQYGIPAAFAGAVETAASMGGLIMPPLMAAAAFIMADFLGVTYWDVVVRGFAVGLVYYLVVAFAVYLISMRTIEPGKVNPPPVPNYDKLKTAVFLGCIVLLVVFLGVLNYSPMRAALYSASLLLGVLIGIHLYYRSVGNPDFAQERIGLRLAKALETYADLTSYIVILMSVLGIMIGLFTITGFILRMGQLMLHLGEWHVAAIVFMAWIFGWLAGTGLPPTATYIIVAVIVVPPMSQYGINPWIAHFFAFLVSVWGELTPPTSLTAAVAASISGASFLRTTYEALRICAPLFVMTFSIFVRRDMVVSPGIGQFLDTLIVAVSSLAITFATFGRFSRERLADVAGRGLLLALAFAGSFIPERGYAAAAAVLASVLLLKGVVGFRTIGPPWGSQPIRPAV
ncbi:MAG: TRAP transporter permease [Firmicutes bacterium]|nr:TRAP transporter permease [Bacillota bacterium]